MTDIMEAGMATFEDKDVKQLVKKIATARANEMGEKVKMSLNKVADQVSIMRSHAHAPPRSKGEKTSKEFDEIDLVRVDTSSLTPHRCSHRTLPSPQEKEIGDLSNAKEVVEYVDKASYKLVLVGKLEEVPLIEIFDKVSRSDPHLAH